MLICEKIPFYNMLSANEKALCSDNAVIRQYKKADIIHNSNKNCLGFISVVHGQLRAYITAENGKELTIYRLTGGDNCMFAAGCVIENIDFDISIDAETDTECIIVPASAFEQLLKNPNVLKYINSLMSRRISDIMWLIEQTLFKSFDRRLAAFLIDQSAVENSLTINLTHEEISRHLGSAREVVSRMLKHFQSEELLVAERGRIIIKNLQLLLEIAG